MGNVMQLFFSNEIIQSDLIVLSSCTTSLGCILIATAIYHHICKIIITNELKLLFSNGAQ